MLTKNNPGKMLVKLIQKKKKNDLSKSHRRNYNQLFLLRMHSLENMVYSTELSVFVVQSGTNNSPHKMPPYI
jgi:hypothetical protein